MSSNCTDCDPINISPCKSVDTSCIIVDQDLTCIGTDKGDTLSNVLEEINQFYCQFSNLALLECARVKLGFDVNTETASHSAILSAIQNYICNFQDVKVKAHQNDPNAGYLIDKISTGDCLDTSIKTVSGIDTVHVSINWACLTAKIPACFTIETNDCFVVQPSTDCLPKPLVPVISKNGTTVTGINCNGVLQWYNSNNQLIGTGSSINVLPDDTYYSKCSTNCGESIASNSVTIPKIVTYTKVRTAVFVRNNCGVNGCNIPCTGSPVEFSRTYSSTVSQEVVNSISQNDSTFAPDGQTYANTVGTCNCSDCNCVFPTFNSNIVKTAPTCNGSVINGNGQILIAGIATADKFGYSVGQGAYSGAGYDNAFTLNNFNQGNVVTTVSTITIRSLSIETRVVVRIFNGSNTCYKDIVIDLTPPNCSNGQVIITDVSVSCEIDPTPVCKSYTLLAGNAPATAWYTQCIDNKYVFANILANGTLQICSKTEPILTGAVATPNGNCV